MIKDNIGIVKSKRQIASIILVWMIVATFLIIVVPMKTPTVRGQVIHLGSAIAEDNQSPYDIDMTPFIVQWDPAEDHIINTDYLVNPGFTLNIPPVNNVNFSGFQRIDVMGILITNDNGNPFSRTPFSGGGFTGWDGIYFHPFSEGRIVDSLIENSANGVVFYPESRLISPGVSGSLFKDIGQYGLRLDGTVGYTNVHMTYFDDRAAPSATSLLVSNGMLNITNTNFWSHAPGESSLHISDAEVHATDVFFRGYNQPGNGVYIEGDSNGTVFSQCVFTMGNRTEADNYYVKCNGSSPLIESSTFRTTQYGARSVIANEDASGIPAHPIVRQPTQNSAAGMWDDSFDSSTLEATGSSSVTLQWYMDVYVKDPNDNLIDNAPVWVKDGNGDPAEPALIMTDASGWARGFIVTELIQYDSTVDNFNPFNVSAEAFSMTGYAAPEPMMNMSKEINVTVPFNLNNILPIVSMLTTPLGVQSGDVIIQYELIDLNPSDSGNLSVVVEFWDPVGGMGWVSAVIDPASDPTSSLNNNTLYTFVWDSSVDFQDQYSTQLKLRITPYDRIGNGTPKETLNFTLDNRAPRFLTQPTVVVSNTTAYINWTVDEIAEASVLYGVGGVITDETTGNSGSTFQSVQLTDLQPGRNYTFIISSTDIYGNRRFPDPGDNSLSFVTQIRIQLYKGWNMISIPPFLLYLSPDEVLAPIAGEYDAVQAYYADDPDQWKHYRPGKPFGNDLTLITEMMGLWIHMKNDAVLIPDHMDPTQDPLFTGTSVVLEQGWNFIGYPSVSNRLIDNALAGVPYDMVQTYDSVTGQWLSYDGSSGPLTKMELGRGYWIHCTALNIWQVDYAL